MRKLWDKFIAPPRGWSAQPCLLDYAKLQSIAEREASNYRQAEPFPHIVIDDLLSQQVLTEVLRTFPSAAELQWLNRDCVIDKGREAQRLKFEFQLGKKDLADEMTLSPALRYLLLEFNSITFLRVLKTLTGIKGLISDPQMWGGGLHQTLPGGLLRVHADFLKHPIYHFDRRLNVLLFLNEDWHESYGGNLELWSSDMSECVKSIPPIANRCVIFTTSETSYHGYTKPIECPDNMTRKSIALYYYAIPELPKAIDNPLTDWQDLPGE